MDTEHPEKEKINLERMADFFVVRLAGYEEHMLMDEGIQAYRKMAELVPADTNSILDLGCGTGLELDEIFMRFPDASVTGIDLTREMLDVLEAKHPDKHMRLICGDYLNVDLGNGEFDTAVSFMSLHHFSHGTKVGLYRKVYKALKTNGSYIECDYMVTEQSVEDELFAENARLRWEQGIPEGDHCHFDTPCTIDTQVMLLKKAGFSDVTPVFREGNTTIITAMKQGGNGGGEKEPGS